MSDANLAIEHLSKVYAGGVRALDDVNLDIREGEFVSLLGPSGCGKTTILNGVAGLDEPTGGRITVGDNVLSDVAAGTFVAPEKRNLGLVFQSYALWPHMNVHGNLAFALKLRKVAKSEINRRVTEALELVGLGGMENRYPFQMSGGQQQRVALARAVVAQPKVLLLDEPLSNLDAKVREQARTWIREFQRRLGITALYVTHDQSEALAISDRIAVLSAGRLLQFDTPKSIYERPASRAVAEFIGSSSFLPAVVHVDGGRARLRLGDGSMLDPAHADQLPESGTPVTIAVRSERVRLVGSSGTNTLRGAVRSGVYLGTSYDYDVETTAGPMRIQSADEVRDANVILEIPADAMVVLAEAAANA